MTEPLQYEIREFRFIKPLTGAQILDIIRDNDLLQHEFYEYEVVLQPYDPQRFITSTQTYVLRFRKRK